MKAEKECLIHLSITFKEAMLIREALNQMGDAEGEARRMIIGMINALDKTRQGAE